MAVQPYCTLIMDRGTQKDGKLYKTIGAPNQVGSIDTTGMLKRDLEKLVLWCESALGECQEGLVVFSALALGARQPMLISRVLG